MSTLPLYNEWMHFSLATLAVAVVLPWLTACSRLGPAPVIEPVAAEIKATRQTKRILVLPTTNTGSGDPNADINRIVPAGAYGRYGEAAVLTAALDRPLKTLSLPTEIAPILPVNWQAAFYRWLKQPKKAQTKKQLAVPAAEARVAKTDDDLKRLGQALDGERKALSAVAKAVETGNAATLAKAQAKRETELKPVESLLRHLMQRFDVTYLLVSHLEGDEDAYDRDAPIMLSVALVNVKTGKFRYYAQSTGKKSDLPTTYTGLVSYMTKNMFDDLADVDAIDL